MAIIDYQTKIGALRFHANDSHLIRIDFLPPEQKLLEHNGNAITKMAFEQLQQYLSGQRQIFNLPIYLTGTTFQQQVWQALQNISYGETRSYQQIAIEVGREKAVRAVGMANNKNPLPIIVPCHRVIGKNGHLVGYAGGLPVKAWLLAMENGEIL